MPNDILEWSITIATLGFCVMLFRVGLQAHYIHWLRDFLHVDIVVFKQSIREGKLLNAFTAKLWEQSHLLQWRAERLTKEFLDASLLNEAQLQEALLHIRASCVSEKHEQVVQVCELPKIIRDLHPRANQQLKNRYQEYQQDSVKLGKAIKRFLWLYKRDKRVKRKR